MLSYIMDLGNNSSVDAFASVKCMFFLSHLFLCIRVSLVLFVI